MFLEATEQPTLRALGMIRGQLVGVALVRSAVVGAGGGAIAVAVAVALSPLTPIGVARRAQLGSEATGDWPMFAVRRPSPSSCWWRWGLPSRSGARPAGEGKPSGLADPAGSGRPSRVAAALAANGVLPTTVTGVRFALERGRGRTAVPVRAALAGAAAAVCAVTAVAGFGASLIHFATTPAAYGVTWDLAVGGFASAEAAEPVARRLLASPDVAAMAALTGQMDVLVDGRSSQTHRHRRAARAPWHRRSSRAASPCSRTRSPSARRRCAVSASGWATRSRSPPSSGRRRRLRIVGRRGTATLPGTTA